MRGSVIIASHNEGDRLWRTVASCIETSVGLDCEIVVADDASWDGSVDEMLRRFPQIRVIRHDERMGASPTKDMGARQARGEILLFLDGHTKPEPGAIQRLIEDVENLKGDAVVTPAIAGLCVMRWKALSHQVGHGYALDLERLGCNWLPLAAMRQNRVKGSLFYESPTLIGCAFAVHRELYDDLRGFDPHMLCWGVEDLDFGLKCWLMGHPILHDPAAVVAHRFQQRFDNFEVPLERLLVNQLRLARKNLTDGVWNDWLARCRARNSSPLAGHPEGLWARVWQLFGDHRVSVEQERAHLLARRVRDEFWYAERFGLPWPKLQSEPLELGVRAFESGAADPSPSPPPCTEDAQEKAWWDEVKGIAVPTITFWVNWLREDDQNACPDLLVCIIRAISYVESRHGHGTGNQAARDPMQVGNPNDDAWENIGMNADSAFDKRPVRQGTLQGLSWKQIPADVNGIINSDPPPNPPVLPYTIDPLFHPNNGHQNAGFTNKMSYFWGIIWYFYSLQIAMPAPRGAWRLGNCDPKVLIDGAVGYNGGGNPSYRKEIEDALKKSCCNGKFNI